MTDRVFGYPFVRATGQSQPQTNFEYRQAELLRSFAEKSVAEGAGTLVWDQSWNTGRGRLMAAFPINAQPDVVAQAMRDLIAFTQDATEQQLRVLYNDRKATS